MKYKYEVTDSLGFKHVLYADNDHLSDGLFNIYNGQLMVKMSGIIDLTLTVGLFHNPVSVTKSEDQYIKHDGVWRTEEKHKDAIGLSELEGENVKVIAE